MSARDLRPALVAAFVLGIALRLAFVGTPGIGFDVGTFRAWAERLREVGPPSFYAPGYFSDYPPGYLYVLWFIAAVLGGMPALAVKAISIPFDVAIAALLYRWTARAAGEGAAVLAAALYLLNPGLVLAGTYWGQMDAVGMVPFLLTLWAAARGRWLVAGAVGGLALMVKPQFGLALVVVWLAALAELARTRRAGPLARATLAAVVVVSALALPFRMDLRGVAELVARASSTYEVTSLFAYNVWAIVAEFWTPDDRRFLALSYQQWGIVLFAIAIAGIALFLWRERGQKVRRDEGRDLGLLLAAGTLAVFAFYFLPTRVHERYLFPAFALLAPFAATRRRFLYAYLVLAVVFFLSVYHAFTRYPQYTGGVLAPALLEGTLYQRAGVVVLSLGAMAAAAVLAWTWVRGRTYALVGERAPPSAAEGPLSAPPAAGELPLPLRRGAAPTRLDLKLALLLALLVLLTRGYRLDWPRDMYFDEVYHARTASELLAGREPYEWTHPHLAKEIMALSIAAFGNVRAVGRGDAPDGAVAYVAAGDGSRAYALPDGAVRVVAPDGRVAEARPVDGPVRALALDAEAVAVATDTSLLELDRAGHCLRCGERGPTRALALTREFVLHATPADVALLPRVPERASAKRVLEVRDAIAVQPRREGSAVYVASGDGRARLISLDTGAVEREWDVGARVATMTVVPDASKLFLGDASEPVLYSIDLEGGGVERVVIENARTAPFRGPPLALATSPRTRIVWVLGQDGVVAVEPHGVSAFAVVREAAGARSLTIDDTRDRVVAAAGIAPVEIDGGHIAFAWRFPGVVLGAVLAAALFLLARRLFAPRLVALALALLVLVDGAMFAQSRIAMNDAYVGAAIVVGWYFIVAAMSPGTRRPRLQLLLAGVVFGLGLAAKWAAGPPILAVGLVSLVVTARSFMSQRPGGGGALDLLALRGLNALYLAFCFIVVPLALYVASYLPWFGLGHGITESPNGGWSFLELQRQMYGYHSGLTAPHAAGSPWWAWPLDLKPVYWEFEQATPETATYIYDAGNLVTWWAGIPAMGYLVYQALRSRAWHLAILVLAFATQYAQWIPVSRVLFQYHFFTALPFYLLALAAALAVLWRRPDRRRWAVGVLAAGLVWFLWFYPWLSAVPVNSTLSALYFWLPTWQYGCQFYPSFRCT